MKLKEEVALQPDSQYIRAALIHAAVQPRDKTDNLRRLLDMNAAAASQGAKIIVNPELATCGYDFNSREEIAPFTEPIPGPTTELLGRISSQWGACICIGLPEADARTGVFYNSAAVIGPDGRVIGKHRKNAPAYKENLWAAEGNLAPLVVPTEYGPLGVVICADTYSYKPVRAAVLQGIRLLLVPANWPADHYDPEIYWRARARENGIPVLVCNRTGQEPGMDCRNAESFAIDAQGQVAERRASGADTIVYCQLPLRQGQFPATTDALISRRRPECYAGISLAAYSHWGAETLLGLPAARDCTAATIQYRPLPGQPAANRQQLLALIDRCCEQSAARGERPDVLVLPELSLTGAINGPAAAKSLAEPVPGPATLALADKAREKDVHILLGMAENRSGGFYNSSVLIGPAGIEGVYRKVHLSPADEAWASPGHDFPVFDLSWGRLGMLLGWELLFPEAVESLAKKGADLLCVPSAWADASCQIVWPARLSEQMHLAIANQWDYGLEDSGGGRSSIYSYALDPGQRQVRQSPPQSDGFIVLRLRIQDARDKKFVERINYDHLLDLGERAVPGMESAPGTI